METVEIYAGRLSQWSETNTKKKSYTKTRISELMKVGSVIFSA